MKQIMAAELSGELLRVALYELIPQIESGKRYVIRVDQVARGEKITMQGNDLSIDLGPMTEEEETEYQPELTYGDHVKALEKRGVSRIDLMAINHAHLEPRDRADCADCAGNEVQTIGIKLRESEAHDWMYNDDAEVVPPKQDDGWIEWRGGECPISREKLVSVRFKNAFEYECETSKAADWNWYWDGADYDICAYRIEQDNQPYQNETVTIEFDVDRELTLPADGVVVVA